MGYFNNSNGLRLNINRSWKTKAFSLRNESLSLIFFQKQFLEFFEVFMNVRKFHRRGMILSHIITKVRGSNGLELDVFIYDPSVSRHSNKMYELLIGDAFLPHRVHKVRERVKKMNMALPYVLRNAVEEVALEYRRPFYKAMERYIKSKFLRIYPKLGLSINFIPLRARMVNAEFLARFFLMKFQYKRELVRIINPVSSRLLRRFGGVRIDCRGRFTKKQRAGKFNFRHGTVSLNNFSHRVDYSQVALPLKYGACSIKLWLANRLASKEYGSEQGVEGFNSFNIAKLPVQRHNLSKYALSLKKGNAPEQVINFNCARVPLIKTMKGSKLNKNRLTPKKGSGIVFTGNNFYNRRVKLGKQIIPKLGSLSKAVKFRFLNKLLGKKAPSWHRKWFPPYRFLTARELSRSVEKEVNKIKRDSVKHNTNNRVLLVKLLSLRKYSFLKKSLKDSPYSWFSTVRIKRDKPKGLKKLEMGAGARKEFKQNTKFKKARGKTRK